MHPLFAYMKDYETYDFFEPADTFYEHAVKLAEGDGRITGYRECFCCREDVRKKNPDLIVCSSLLHEVQEPEKLLADIKRTAGKETVVHINVPNADSFHRILALSMGLIQHKRVLTERNLVLQQNRVFDLDSLCSLAEDQGLRVTGKGSYFIKPFTHSQMWDMLKSGIIDENVLDGLYAMSGQYPENGSEIYVNCTVRE